MKISTALLAGSVVINAALLAVIVAGSSAPDFGSASWTSGSAPAAPAAPKPAVAAAAPGHGTWSGLGGDDLVALRDRLRAEGFPPALIRAILAAQIREGFAARRKALTAAQGEIPYWKMTTPDPKIQAEWRELSNAEQKQLKDLLGPDPDNGVAVRLRRELPGAAEDQIEQLAQIRERYDELRSDFYNARGGSAILPDEREKLTAMDKAMHAEFSAVLSPAQLEDYDLRTSNVANNLRYNLNAFDPTEQEFRALYKLQSAFDDQFAMNYGPSMSQDQMRARSAAQKQLTDDIQAALGPDRFADYQRATDYNFRQTSQLVARLELPPEAANQVYAVQKDIQDRVNAVRQSGTIAFADRTAQLTALADEATTRVTAVLGARGFEAYKQNGGSWLQNVAPRPMPPPPTK